MAIRKCKTRTQHPCYSCNAPIALKVNSKWMCPDCIKEERLTLCSEHGEWFQKGGHCITCRRQPHQHCEKHQHWFETGATCYYCYKAPNHEITPDDWAWLKLIGIAEVVS